MRRRAHHLPSRLLIYAGLGPANLQSLKRSQLRLDHAHFGLDAC